MKPANLKKYGLFELFLIEKRGFTLIELLVAVTVFIIAIVSIAAVFISTIQAHRKSEVEQRVQAETRYAMEMMTREVRDGFIAYGDYSGGALVTSVQTELNLIRPNSEKVRFYKNGSRLMMRVSNGAVDDNDVLGSDVQVDDLKFSIYPLSDPYDVGNPLNLQPRVTILLVVSQQGAGAKPESEARMQIQTTVSSREYKR